MRGSHQKMLNLRVGERHGRFSRRLWNRLATSASSPTSGTRPVASVSAAHTKPPPSLALGPQRALPAADQAGRHSQSGGFTVR